MKILVILDWLKKTMSDKTGSLLLAFLLGMIIPGSVCYFFSLELKSYEYTIKELNEKNIVITNELKEWQRRAFKSDSLCIEKMKNMASFFKGIKGGYQEQINTTKSTIKNNDKSLIDQCVVDKELRNMKTKVNSYE